MKHNIKDLIDGPGPLEGVRVVEYAVFHAGPGAGAILGDLGADVIKIEGGDGDPMRYWKRAGKVRHFHGSGKNPMFEFSNRNKRCICLDIKSEKGWAVFEDLIRNADVFLTNLRKSTKPKLKIDYESIKAINPKIIYSSVSGYGNEGAFSDVGAFDPLGQARSGMMYLADDKKPSVIQLAILDQATAITASHAILTALYTKERDGIGQEVHNSLYSSALWLMHANMLLTNFDITNSELTWTRMENSPLRNSFCCKDGKWIIGAHHPAEKYWPILCKSAGVPHLIEDPRFIDEEARHENSEELIPLFDKEFIKKTRDEWLEIVAKDGLMFSPIQKITDVVDDHQAHANNYVTNFDHPDFGPINVPGYPVDFSTFKAGMKSAAPDVGQHSDEILKELNFSDEHIRALREEKIIG